MGKCLQIVIMFGNYQAFEISAVARYRSNSAGGRAIHQLLSVEQLTRYTD